MDTPTEHQQLRAAAAARRANAWRDGIQAQTQRPLCPDADLAQLAAALRGDRS